MVLETDGIAGHSLTETFVTSFTLTGAGWSETSNVWIKTVGSKRYTFSEATGILTLNPTASYASWIDGFFPGENNPVNADPDGNTQFSDYLLFTYRRSDLAGAAGMTANCEINTDLVSPWTLAAAVSGVVILVDDNFNFTPPAPGTDRVRVFIPRAANPVRFGRLKVQVP